MNEEAKTNQPSQGSDELNPLITQPHGREQQMEVEILNMIHSGESPYDIIYRVAQRLEKASGEPGYAAYVKDQLRAVYGFALQEGSCSPTSSRRSRSASAASSRPTTAAISPRRSTSASASPSTATKRTSSVSRS